MQYDYRVDMRVRIYECDPQGIVNNAVYLHYLEHARSEWLKTMGLNYAQMCVMKQYMVVSEMNVNFKHPLVYDDDFFVAGNVQRESKMRVRAQQDIYRHDDKLVLTALVDVIGLEGDGNFRLPQVIIDTYPVKK